jgi:hypothetical protein
MPLRHLPFTSKWGLSDLWEVQAKGWVRSSLWALEHLSFMKQSLWHLLLLEVKPPRWLGIALELSRLWWAVGKFVKVCFASERKEAKASEVRKAVERDPTWSWHLVGVKVVLWHFHRSRSRAARCGSFAGKAFSLLVVSSRWTRWTWWLTWFGLPERNTLRPRENWVVLCSSLPSLSLFFFRPLGSGVYPVFL